MVTHRAMLPWDWAMITQCEHAVMAPGHGDTSDGAPIFGHRAGPWWHLHGGSRRDPYCSNSLPTQPSDIASEVPSYLGLRLGA